MNFTTLVLLAFGLSMDAFAVSICNCLAYQKYHRKEIIVSAIFYGIFQGLMPMIGFILGNQFLGIISIIDHWVALILLSIIGGKMIIESFSATKDEEMNQGTIAMKTLIIQSIATSIDALAVGISMAALQVDIVFACASIAGITFINCCIGGFLGKRFGKILGDRAQLIGGIILILIGLNIFIEHVFL